MIPSTLDGERFKVSLIGSLPPIKGISPYCHALAQSLKEHVDLEFLGFRRLYPDFLYPGGTQVTAKGMAPPSLTGARLRNNLTYYNPLSWLRAGLTLRGDLVHAQWWSYVLALPYLMLLGLARLQGRTCVLTVHNVRPHEQGTLARWLNNLVLKMGHHYIVHDLRSRRQLAILTGIEESRIHVVPHGVLEPAPIRGTGREEARRRLGFLPGSRVVLHFGNIRRYKGVDTLLEAMALVVKEEPQALLVVAGQPWGSWQPYARIIHELGLTGHVVERLDFIPPEEVEDIFAAADVVALPYRAFDSQSGVGAMALSFGRAMVVTDVGGLPGLVRSPQAVVPPEDPQALAQALLTVLKEAPWQQRLEEESRIMAKQYQWEDIAQRTVEVYRRAMEYSGERVAQVRGGGG
ncbi:MAG: glycosyltransferase [Chloroflexota bacterium]